MARKKTKHYKELVERLEMIISELRHSLEEVRKQKKTLEEREQLILGKLEPAIALRNAYAQDVAGPAKSKVATSPAAEINQIPLRQAIHLVLRDAGRSLTIREIVMELVRRGRFFRNPVHAQIMVLTVLRRDTTAVEFSKDEKGRNYVTLKKPPLLQDVLETK